MYNISLQGEKSLIFKLDQMSIESAKRVKAAIEKGAEKIRADADVNAPKDTGDLSIDIKVEDGETGGIATYIKKIGPADPLRSSKAGIPYSVFQEFGLSNMDAHPYMIPAYDANKDAIIAEIAKFSKGL